MRHLRATGALVLTLGMAGALAGCGQDSDDVGADPSPTTATSPVPTTTPATPATDSAPVLGPDGIGALALGMDRDQASASGVVTPFQLEPGADYCMPRTALTGAPAQEGLVYYSTNLGVAAIEAYAGIRTPEGIEIGSPLADVDEAYPDWNPSGEIGRGWAPVPGNDEAVYRIAFDDGAVTALTLQYLNQDCYE